MLLGLPFHDMTMEEAVREAMYCIDAQKPVYFVTPNVDFAAQAHRSESLRQILFHAKRVLCDGTPLLWASKLLGGTLRERLAGADFLPNLLKECERNQKSVFFLGEEAHTISHLQVALNKNFPQLTIVGYETPPQGNWKDWDNELIVKNIRQSRPDLLIVALGCPKQEEWIFQFHQSTQVPLSIGVGSGLSFLAGTQLRAPKFLQKIGLEWLWRLLLEPKRLFSRYSRDIFFLFWATLKQYRSLKTLTKKSQKKEVHTASQHYCVLQWEGKIERATLHQIKAPMDYEQAIVIEGSGVTFIDSSGLGLIAKILREAKQNHQKVILKNPSSTLLQAVRTVHLDKELEIL